MTRNDFQILARTLRTVRDSYGTNWDPNLFRACTDHAKAFASACKAINPSFKRGVFLRAAGVPEAEIDEG